MSTIKVITNSLGLCDRTIVYETRSGEVVFDGNEITPKTLFHILSETNGLCGYVRFHELTDEQMENWEEHV